MQPVGWDKFSDQNVAAIRGERLDAAKEYASMFHDVFKTDAGQRLLEQLKREYLNNPVLGPDSTQFGAGIREGENRLVRKILQQMIIAEGGLDERRT